MKNKIMQCITAASLSLAMLVSPALTNGIAAEEEAPHYYLNYYRDAQKKQKVDLSEIADNAPVYYTLIPADGCFIYTLKTNGTYTDDEKMIFASSDRTVDISSYLAGDITGDGKLNTRDIVRGMKYIAGSFGTGEIHNEQLTAFDSNFDTVIDVKDLVRAMKLIAGADVDLSLEWYGGRQLSYKHNYYYSALTREMGNVSQFYISTINTLEEFNEYISAAQRVFDYEADLTFVDERDRGRYESRTVDAEALKALYNEAFFSNHTLIAASIYSIDESTKPILLDVMENGYNIPCVEFSYRLFNYDEDYGLFGAVDCFVHNFIELDKINYVPEYEDGEIIVGRYVIRGLQEYNRVTG